MTAPIFYVVEIALPDAALPDFVPWYAAVHAPHLFHAGFTACASYRAVAGGMAVVDIYQAGDWAMFEASAFARYREVARRDPFRPKALHGIANARTVYHHHPATPWPSGDATAPLDADWVTIRRFDADAATEDRIAGWLRDGGAAGSGVNAVRLLRRGRDAPTGTSARPRLALVTESRARPGGGAFPPWLAALLTAPDDFTGSRLYPWADDPALRLPATA